MERNFDIEKEAGYVSYKVVKKDYTALVVDNFLEIHLFWAGKGTCCIPNQHTYGPAIAAISVFSKDSNRTSSRKDTSASGKKKNTGLVVGTLVGVAVFLFLFVLGIFTWRERRKRLSGDDDEAAELLGISRADTFSYAALRTATEDFNPANKLGEGGFGPVFKGKLSDGRVVAVKQLSVESHQGKRQFVTEVATISAVHHRNLVKLYGCCFEGGERLLVYEYLENGSLDQALFGKNKSVLDWPTRSEICLGTARGLAYLHEESRLRIIHRDVKASNILLDSDLKPKISDFGLAKIYNDKKTHISTRVAGTIGYLAPEYAMRGNLSEKADVFGFGVVAVEILSVRPNTDTSLPPEKIYLLEWDWHLHENKRELEMVDPMMLSYSKEEALRVIGVSLLCTQASPNLRLAMSRVVAMLAGEIKVSGVTSRPGYLTDWQFDDLSSSFANVDNFSTTPTVGSNQVSTFSNEIPVIGSTTMPGATQPILHEIVGDGR